MANKKSSQLVSFLVVLFLVVPFTFAQTTNQTPAQTQPHIVRKTILDYKDELKLTDKQVKTIKGYLSELEKKNKELQERINSIDQEVRTLLEKDSDMKQIGNKIRESFGLRAESTITEIETGRKIDKSLTLEQLNKWKEMKLKEVQKIKGGN